MKTDLWMPIFIGDYLKDTRHLTTEEHGVYFLILMEIWNKGGWVEKKYCPKISLLSQKTFSKRWENLKQFFIEKDGFISQKRALKEIQKSQTIKEIRTKIGKLGGRPKTNRLTKRKPNENQKVNQNETKTKPNSKPNQNQNITPSPSHINNTSIIEGSRPHKQVLEDVIVFFGMSPATKSDWSRVGKLARDFGQKGMTLRSLKIRADLYRKEWPNITLTPEALLKHWDHFGEKERKILEAEQRKIEEEQKRRQEMEEIPDPTPEEKEAFSSNWRNALNG